MSLTRKMLKAFGIEDTIIEQIIEAHTETTDSLKAERDRYKGEASKVGELEERLAKATDTKELDGLRDELDKRTKEFEKQAKELEKAKEDLGKVQTDFDGYKAGVEAEKAKSAKESAYRALLAGANVNQKYMDVIVRATKLDDMELGEDGKLKDEDKISESIKSDWSEFIKVEGKKGSEPENPPKNEHIPEGASEIARQVTKEHHERLYGKSEE